MLAAKAALACRVDALSEEASSDIGLEQRARVEARIRQLEGGAVFKISGSGKKSAQFDKYENKSEIVEYKTAADSTIKRELEDAEETSPKKIKVEEEVKSEKKKKKKIKTEPVEDEEVCSPKEKKKKVKVEAVEAEPEAAPTSEKKKKKKKDKQETEEESLAPAAENGSSKKKKKKKDE